MSAFGTKRTCQSRSAMSAFGGKADISRTFQSGHWPRQSRVTGGTEYLTAHYSGLMLAARITSAHFSISSAINLPKSVGEPASTVPPRSAIRAFILGSARAALISLLSVSMILAGVLLGAPMPDQAPASYPGGTRRRSEGW